MGEDYEREKREEAHSPHNISSIEENAHARGVSEQYVFADAKIAKNRYIKAVCELCSKRYQCMTDRYKMNIRGMDKFVLIPKKNRKIEVFCDYFNLIK